MWQVPFSLAWGGGGSGGLRSRDPGEGMTHGVDSGATCVRQVTPNPE